MKSSRERLRTLLISAGTVVTLVGIVAFGTARSNAASVPFKAFGHATSAGHDVLLVGNSVGGTVSFLDGTTFANLGSLNVIPDLAERLAAMNPIERAGYELVKQQEGGDRFVDDMFVSPDGRTLYVSRANLADVVAVDLVTHQQRWRFKVDGIHADHMAMSPDGTRIVVSATTGQQAQVLNASTGALVGHFGTGAYPHQNDYSADGSKIFNSSIGITAMPKALEFLKGQRQVTVVDAKTFRTIRTYTFDHGVRPSVIMPDEKTMYAELSYLNGFVEYDLVAGKITRTVTMPYAGPGVGLDPDRYPQNSAHHGLALSGDNSKLCDVGTIDNYVAIVSRPGLTTDRIIPVGHLPYWATTSKDGTRCLVSLSEDNAVSVISYDTAQEITRVPVGNFPQRERTATVAQEALNTLSPAAG
jgi:DNA-binding beta-propeller fold protein YncE